MIPVSKPIIAKNAKKYILECLKTGWISGAGPFINTFEENFANFTHTKYAVACTSGTTALHLAVKALKIGPGNEVILPAFTMISSILPIIYTGATPILVDVEEDTGNIDARKMEEKITKNTKAIMVVHINGHPADMSQISNLAKKYNLSLIEDAAEAHGALCLINNQWRAVGSIGDIGCFSLYANKIVTSGEGGIATTNSKKLASRMRSLRNLARTPSIHFFHQEIAFNYRMSSLQAALGIAQLEDVKLIIQKKRHIASLYNKLLTDIKGLNLPPEKDYAKSVFWHYGVKLRTDCRKNRDQLEIILQKNGIETRNFFIPLHLQPVFKKMQMFLKERYPVSETLGKSGINLPTGPNLKDSEIKFVCKIIKQSLSND